jgi:hypothetical protein
VDASTNTETNAVLDEKVKNIEESVNTAFCQLKKRGNVIDSAYSKIAKIRRDFPVPGPGNQQLTNYSPNPARKTDDGFDIRKSKLDVNRPEFVPRTHANIQLCHKTGHYISQPRPWRPAPGTNHNLLTFDPAIISIQGPSYV